MNLFPPPLMTSDPGSFAQATIVERKPKIINQVISKNAYPSEIVDALTRFREEIASQKIQPITEETSDRDFWNGALAASSGKSWLEVPWYFAETYFYRRLLEAVRYEQSGVWHGVDPFREQKQHQTQADMQRLALELKKITNLAPETAFETLLYSSLWGNRSDLSQTTEKEKRRNALAIRTDQHFVLIDHVKNVRAHLVKKVQRMDFVTDNVGSDVLLDLALADFLIQQGWTREIYIHAKNYPFFISDAMPEDIRIAVSLLEASPDTTLARLGDRLAAELRAGRLSIDTHPFWTSCQMLREMPAAMREDFARSDLVILKGDVNYRRLLDDLHWPHSARMEEITEYFPASFVTLRTLKSEIMVGLQPGQSQRLSIEDPSWLINGQRGVIQFINKHKK
jgi:uncharacterized protein with ATP-grasp and redox domains